MGDRVDDHGMIHSCERTPEFVSTTGAEEWADLADDELFARLVQRNVTLGTAEFLVTYRDEPVNAVRISSILG